ncbi:MAG TPA: hypothetical protein VLZ50_14660 [Terracidiphilus sp.]|nr:hypothetical protein [Terracidiphilus sp.]
MRNITVSIDEETYRRARIWAAERGTSVSAMVKCILVTLPSRASARKPRAESAAVHSPPPSPSAASSPVAKKNVTLIPSWGASVLEAVQDHIEDGKAADPS